MPREDLLGELFYIPVLFFLCLVFFPLAYAQDTLTPPLSIDEIIEKVVDSYAKVENFQCLLDKFERLGEKRDLRTYKYFFMKPRLIRMDIIKGKNRGAIAIYRNGLVKARKGGLLRPFRLTCEPTHKTVISLRGGTVLDSDWQNIIDKLLGYQKSKKLKIAGIRPYNGRAAYLIEVEGISEDGITKRKLFIDTATYLPLGTETYEGKVLVNSMMYSNIVVNGDMSKSIFN